MKATYMKRFQKLSHALKNTDLMEHARMDEHNTYSRKRKIPLEDILLSFLARKGLTTTLEPRIFQTKEDFSMEISKQGYLQQRKRLNPDIFTHLNDQYLMDFYNSSEVSLWNGFLLLGIDGSNHAANVPMVGASCYPAGAFPTSGQIGPKYHLEVQKKPVAWDFDYPLQTG